jgi:hypothetical protein
VPGPRRRALLVVLALAIGEVVSAGRLIDIVWNGRRRRDQGWISSAGLIGERRGHCAANRSTPCRRQLCGAEGDIPAYFPHAEQHPVRSADHA